LDLEGITLDGEGGFWLASEGDSAKLVPHALYRVDADGKIVTEVPFPAKVLAGDKRFGAEGIARVGEGDEETLWVAMQREWVTIKPVRSSFLPISLATRAGAPSPIRSKRQRKAPGW